MEMALQNLEKRNTSILGLETTSSGTRSIWNSSEFSQHL